MASQSDQFTDIPRKALDVAMRLAQLSIENSQRIMALQVDTARTIFEQSIENTRAMTSVQDPKAALDLRTDYARATTDKLMEAARQLAQIASDTQNQFAKMMGDQFSGGSKDMMDMVQKIFSFNPSAGQAVQSAMSSLQQAMDTSRGAFEQLTKVSTETMSNLGATVAGAAAGTKKGK